MNKQIKRMDDIWSKLIKAKAGFISQINGDFGREMGGNFYLEAHHLHGKKNHHLRYSIENGICITNIEHNFHAHGHENHGRTRHHPFAGRSLHKKFRENVKALRGEDIYERLQVLKDDRSLVDLDEVETFLKSELKKYEN